MIARHLIRLTALAVLAYLALPLVVILGASFTATPYLAFPPQGWTLEWYRTLLVEAGYMAAFTTSTVLALAATVAAVLLTVPAALALARYEFPGKAALTSVLMSPLVLPHIVLGAALLQFGAYFGLTRSFLSLLIGHVVIIAPFVLRSTLTLLTPEQRALEEASADLGASPVATFLHVTWPLTLPGVVSGAIIVFTLAVSAYVTPALLSGGRVTVLSMLIFQQYSTVFDFHYGGALSMVLLVFTLILVALANRAATLPGAAR